MPLREYLRILWKRGWIIIVMATVTAASAVVFSLLQRPVYRSTVQLNVMPARLDLGLTQSIKWLMRNYAANILSNTTLDEVIKRSGQDMTADMLRSRIRVSPIESDFLIEITVDDYDPEVARILAQHTADVFVERIQVYMLDQDKRDRVDVEAKDAAKPAYLQFPKKKINALAGGVFGVLLGVVIVLGLEWVDAGIVRSPDDLERACRSSVLGMIPEA
ncbi:MAG: Wzz/FepE/Etk N-terminal domain-containing protein [Anaerolineae bacterium]|nr:Wzz/FepE/Etk N-terminal domain-containing protein [Anaerolineae bacterium]